MKNSCIIRHKKLLWFIGALTLIRLAVSASFELSTDEAYYWQWSDYLSLSYYDHPPMVALMIAITTLFSDAEFFIRLGPVLSVAALSYLLYLIAQRLYNDGGQSGLNAVLLANLTLILSVGALIATPDAPLIPFYTSALLVFLSAVNAQPGTSGSWFFWIATGVLIGLAMLSKYTGFFFYPCAVLFIALSGKHRFWFTRPEPYIGVLVTFALFSPVIIWNARHDWVSFTLQAGHGLASRDINRFEYFSEFIGLQVILYSIGIFFLLMIAFAALCRKIFSSDASEETRDAALYLFSFSAPILAFFFVNSFRTQIEGNWPVLGFIPLFIQAGRSASQFKGKNFFRFSVGLAAFLLIFLHIQIVNPVIPHPQRYEISRRIFGWELLGSTIDAELKKSPAAFLISNRHQIGSLMTYYTETGIPAYLLGGNNRRLNFLPPVDSYKGSDALYLTQVDRDHTAQIAPLFDSLEKIGATDIIRKGELIRSFILYRCYNYHGGLEGI